MYHVLMPLHPQSKAVLEQMAAQGGKPIEESPPAEVRAAREQAGDAFAALAGSAQEVARVEDRAIPGPAQPIPVRIYWPETSGKLPVLVYFHGGGWVFGTIDSTDRTCRALANSARCIVVNVAYRLAPADQIPPAVGGAFGAPAAVARPRRGV